MMDKDTGRPRGFGFVTFEGEAAVEACLAQPLAILDKPIEVKRAQPRGNMREEEESRGAKFNGRRGQNDRFDRGGRDNQGGGGNMDNQQNQGGQQNGMTNGMSPQMMAQYWQRMQQYFAMMQQTMASQANMGGGGGQGMNPMMQQMMMQQMQNQGGGGGMNPQMMQQMQQMQMQQQQQQQQQSAPTQDPRMASPMPGNQGMGNGGNRQGSFPRTGSAGPAQPFNNNNLNGGNFNSGSPPQSWDGMYDDVPPPNAPGGRGRGGYQGGGSQGHGTPQPPQGQAPLNAPTGPKNLNRPGANYRGGGRGNRGGFHPYGRGRG